jgi:NADPH2:quinone reductase
MSYPLVVPHSDAAGVINAVGAGVDHDRIGQRVWVYGAQSYRPFGTAGTVVATVQHRSDLEDIDRSVVSHAVALDQPDSATAIREHAPDGVARIVEVSMSDNADLDAAVVANDAVIAAYATRLARPELPFWPLLFANVTLRLLGSDDFSPDAKQQAARDLTAAAAAGALSIKIGRIYPLAEIAAAQDRVDAGGGGRILLSIPA